MSHFAEFLPALAEYLDTVDREKTLAAMGEDPSRLGRASSSDLLAGLEQRWNAAVAEAAQR